MGELGRWRVGLAALAVVAGCSGAEGDGNAALGIAAFRVSDGPERTTIVGVDGVGAEVARVELTHGRFTPTVDFGVEGDVDGRRLVIDVAGEHFGWETLGTSDTTRMPALPGNLGTVAALVADSHVRPVLDRWQIGWRAPEVGFDQAHQTMFCDYPGTDVIWCSGNGGPSTCPIVGGGMTAACNGGNNSAAVVVTEDLATFGHIHDENRVQFCCLPAGSDGLHGSYAAKTCAAVKGGGSCPVDYFCSACGDAGANKCIACFTPIPYTAGCALDVRDTGTLNLGGKEIFQQCHHFCPANGAAQLTVTGGDVTLECHAGYTDQGATAIDVCEGDVSASIAVTSDVDANEVGSYTVGYSFTNQAGFVASGSRAVAVVDTTAPAVDSSTPVSLWPPDLRMHAYTLADCVTASDACAGDLDVNAAGRVISITSNQRGSHESAITGQSSFALRAGFSIFERNPRVYTIDYVIMDPAGNETPGACTVRVARPRGRGLPHFWR